MPTSVLDRDAVMCDRAECYPQVRTIGGENLSPPFKAEGGLVAEQFLQDPRCVGYCRQSEQFGLEFAQLMPAEGPYGES